MASTQQLEVTRWTSQQLEHLVATAAPQIAVFDCDGTLWSGDSGNGFMVWSIDQGLVSRSTSDWLDTRYRAYLAGTVDEATMCGEMVQIYAGLREQELRGAASRYFNEHVSPHIFSELAALVDSHAQIQRRTLGRQFHQ